MATEVEARFRAADDETLARLAAVERIGGADIGPPVPVDEEDRYLDTDDGRMAAARWACRLRTRDGVTRISLKGPSSAPVGADPWLHRRPEVEGPASATLDPAAWPPSAARDRLLELTGGGELHERFRLLQRRTERPVSIGGRALGTLTLDAVRIVHAGREIGDLRIVELELAAPDRAAEASLAELAHTLSEVPGLEPEARTKLEQASARMERM